jgi:hypothetical protein
MLIYLWLVMYKLIKKICLLVFLCPFLLFAQEQKKTLLIVPLSKNNVWINSVTGKSIKYNNISRDSLADYIIHTTNSELQNIFKDYSLKYLSEFSSSEELPDSMYKLKLFNCFYFDSKDSSLKNIRNKPYSMDSYHNNYYGIELNHDGLKLLKQSITASKCDYILFINKFEIINPNSAFCMHVEIMDNALNRIYGNKNEQQKDVSKTMYYDVLKFYIKSTCTNMMEKVRGYLKE